MDAGCALRRLLLGCAAPRLGPHIERVAWWAGNPEVGGGDWSHAHFAKGEEVEDKKGAVGLRKGGREQSRRPRKFFFDSIRVHLGAFHPM